MNGAAALRGCRERGLEQLLAAGVGVRPGLGWKFISAAIDRTAAERTEKRSQGAEEAVDAFFFASAVGR